MKAPTDAYKNLISTLTQIKPILYKVPDTSCNTKIHHLKVQSYILLTHAAFEEYLERLSKDISTKAIELYNRESIISKALVSMTAYETIAQLEENNARKKISSDVASNFSTFANLAKVNLHKQIEKNHGVRKENQRSLLVPIGIEPDDIDPLTSNALDAYGVKRGDIAHKVIITRKETKSSIIGEIKIIKDGLIEFDKAACKALSIGMKKM
ncbi:HEPN domain-containing protein [Asticcacaulis sp. YBE204]|uniref:HEPN domain-containing protein n=1 Tax=Asticcacaulis sp. YBE204 TaxID=1282363 RepID=UPI0012DF672A|nr:HEPN domain-containing protein [Asticcacaulis sp. YBE204]